LNDKGGERGKAIEPCAEPRLWDAATAEEEELYKSIVEDRVKHSPYYELLGMEVIGLAPGEARLRIATGPHLHDDDGLVHKGVLFSLADASSGVAMTTIVSRGSRRVATVEIKANFLASVKDGVITATGRVIAHDGGLAISEAEIRDEKDVLLAKGMATFIILPE
jgi:uncharacterized protein (TIGR00369 family)